MAEPRSIQQQLEDEKKAIESITDTTEAALASSCFRLKVDAHKGVQGAAASLVKAQKALDEYVTQRDAGTVFQTGAEIFRHLYNLGWRTAQGKLTVKTITNHIRHGHLRPIKGGGFKENHVLEYAQKHLIRPGHTQTNQPEPESQDHKTEIQKETARKLRLLNETTEGSLIPREEAEARWIQAAAFLKQDLINFGPKAADLLLEALSLYLRENGADLDGLNLSSVSADLLEIYDRSLEAWLDRYARTAKTPEPANVC